MRYHILHETLYEYGATVSLAQHLLHLSPRTTDTQSILHHEITAQPQASERSQREDWFGNTETHLAISAPHDTLRVHAFSTVEVSPRPAQHREATGPAWESVAADVMRYPGDAPLDAIGFAQASPQVPLAEPIRAWARQSFTSGRPLLVAARALMAQLHREFTFDPKATTIATPVLEVFKRRRGVCQDFTHLMLSALRSLGLPARYMSGYLLTTPPPGKPRLVGADASHAWVALWCPEIGWVEFDPTNNLQPGDEHIVLGWGRDFADVTPMRGVILGGASHDVEVAVTVMPAELRDREQLLRDAEEAAVQRAAAREKARESQ